MHMHPASEAAPLVAQTAQSAAAAAPALTPALMGRQPVYHVLPASQQQKNASSQLYPL